MLAKKLLVWIFVILVLVILNLWKWLPTLGKGSSLSLGSVNIAGLSLNIPSGLEDGEKTVHRDLFALGPLDKAGGRANRMKLTPVRLFPTPISSPMATPDGSVLEVEGGYRLMGIVERDGKSLALIGKGSQLFQVGLGDDLEGHYQVHSITDDEVYLTETQTGNTLKLRMWDQNTKTY